MRAFVGFLLSTKTLQARIPSFRDALLRQKPTLLDTFINRAIDSDSAFDKVFVQITFNHFVQSLLNHSILMHAFLFFLTLWTLQCHQGFRNF